MAKIPPPLALVLSLGAAALLTRFVPALQWVGFRSLPAAGALGVFALGMVAWAWVEFRRYRTTILPLREPTSLLCAGPFRFTRNPIYLGLLLLAFAPWLAWGAVGWLLAPPLFFAVINGAVIPVEEAALHRAFGAAYEDYCHRVKRWL